MNKNEREINLKLLLAYIMRQWRKILIVMIICGLSATAYKYLKAFRDYDSLQKKYVSDLDTYITSTADVAQQTQKNQDIINNLTDYTKNSIKANIDPMNEIKTISSISIITSSASDSVNEVLTGMSHAKQITQAYAVMLDNIDYSEAASSLNTSIQMVKELVSIKSDTDSSTIVISVIGSTNNQTETIMKSILSVINDKEDQVISKYGDYSAIVSDMITNSVVDSSLVTVVGDKTLSVNAVMNDALTKINGLTKVQKNLANTVTSKPTPVINTIVNSSVKFFIFGAAASMMVIILLLIIVIVCSGKILSEEDLNKIWGLKILAVLQMKQNNKKNTKFDKFILRKIDSAYGISDEDASKRAIINISHCDGEHDNLAVVGINIGYSVDELTSKLRLHSKKINYVVFNQTGIKAGDYDKLNDSSEIVLVCTKIFHHN